MSIILKRSLKISALCLLATLSGKTFAMDPSAEEQYRRAASAHPTYSQPPAMATATSLPASAAGVFFPETMRTSITPVSVAPTAYSPPQPPSYRETELASQLMHTQQGLAATHRELSMTQSTLVSTRQALATLQTQTEVLVRDVQLRVMNLTKELQSAKQKSDLAELQCQLKTKELDTATAKIARRTAQLDDMTTRCRNLCEESLGVRLTLTHENSALRRALRQEREESRATVRELLGIIEALQVVELAPRAAAAAAPRVDVVATVRRARAAAAAPAGEVVVAPNRFIRGGRFTEDAANRGSILIMKASETPEGRALVRNPAAAREAGPARTVLIQLIRDNLEVRRLYAGITDEEIEALIEGGIRGIEAETLRRPNPAGAAAAAAV